MSVAYSQIYADVQSTWQTSSYFLMANKARNPTTPDTGSFTVCGANDDNEIYEAKIKVPLLKTASQIDVEIYMVAPAGNTTGCNLKINGSTLTEDIVTLTGTGSAAWYVVTFTGSWTRAQLSGGFNLLLDARAMPAKSVKSFYAIDIKLTGVRVYPAHS